MNRSAIKPRTKRAPSLPVQTGTSDVAAMEADPENNISQTATDHTLGKDQVATTADHPTNAHEAKMPSATVKNADSVVIKVENLTKSYHIYDKPHDSLKQALYPGVQRVFGQPQKQYYREFKALNDVSFEVMKGETVGIIGPNGAGKSTLLQLICGTLSPTSGTLQVNGRITALLELGSGFNPQFSGRENVYISCAILGLSQDEINARYAQIVEFADIGDFIDQPVKTYSSGMTVRLAFATQTALDPQILIVDEALAVGDMSFQIKCYARMNQLKERGTTILFVSHSLETVRSFCDRAIYLRRGKQLSIGSVAEVTKQYQQDCLAEKMQPRAPMASDENRLVEPAPTTDPKLLKIKQQASIARDYRQRFLSFVEHGTREGSQTLSIESFVLLHEDDTPAESILPTEEITGCFLLKFNSAFTGDIHLAIQILDKCGTSIMVVRDTYFEQSISGEPESCFLGTMKFTLPIRAGIYYCKIGVLLFPQLEKYKNGKINFEKTEIADLVEHGAHFQMYPFDRHPLPVAVLNESKLTMTHLD